MLKKVRNILIYLAAAAVFSYGIHWMMPYLVQSAFMQGLMVAVGFLSLPFFTLLLIIDKGRSYPFPLNAWFPRMLLALKFFSLSAVFIIWGLGFWYPGLRVVAYWAVGIFGASGLVYSILLRRAERANSLNDI